MSAPADRARKQHESPNLSKALVWDTSSADNFDARRWTRTLAHESDTNPVSQRDRRTGAAQPQMTYREQNKTMHIPTVSRLEPKGSLKYMFPNATGKQPPAPQATAPPPKPVGHGYDIVRNSAGANKDKAFVAKESNDWKRRNGQQVAAVPVNQRDRGYNVLSGVPYDMPRAAREERAVKESNARRYHLVRHMAEKEEARRNEPVRKGKRLGIGPANKSSITLA